MSRIPYLLIVLLVAAIPLAAQSKVKQKQITAKRPFYKTEQPRPGKPFYRLIEPPKNVARLNKALITATGIDRANILITRANYYQAAGLEDSARRELDRALNADPESEAVIILVAGLITGSGMPERCEGVEQIASSYLSKHPKSDAVLAQRAKAKKCLGRVDDAFEDLMIALEIAPTNISYLSALMNLPFQVADREKELAIYQKVIDYLLGRVAAEQPSRSNSYIKNGLAGVFLTRSHLYGKLGDRGAELADATRSVELGPYNLGFRSRIYEKYEMYDEAIADMTSYIAYLQSPDYSRRPMNLWQEYWIRASLFAKSGRFSEAIGDYEKSLKANPKNTSIQKRIDELQQKIPKDPK